MILQYPVVVQISTILAAVIVWFGLNLTLVSGHGRMIEPPSRASAWRYGFNTPPNYNDHELYCGGFTHQWQKNDGKCGECGDPWDSPTPRGHEYGGKWGQGVIVRKYNPGTEILLRIELTASHMGYFEFRVCPKPDGKQDCLDKHVLKLLGGTPSQPKPTDLETRFYPRNGNRIYEIRGKLPDNFECGNCLLQWRYIAGNNWGTCEDGTGAVGCGPQEEFRACSDISIGEGAVSPPLPPLRPVRPGVKSTVRPTKIATATDKPTTDEHDTGDTYEYKYTGLIIAGITLLLVLCVFAAVYLYYYHGKWMKGLLRRSNQSVQPKSSPPFMASKLRAEKTNPLELSLPTVPPVPPPRTKRIRDIEANESSVFGGSNRTESSS